MQTQRAGSNRRISTRLQRHAKLMTALMAKGLSREAASEQAFAAMEREDRQ